MINFKLIVIDCINCNTRLFANEYQLLDGDGVYCKDCGKRQGVENINHTIATRVNMLIEKVRSGAMVFEDGTQAYLYRHIVWFHVSERVMRVWVMGKGVTEVYKEGDDGKIVVLYDEKELLKMLERK